MFRETMGRHPSVTLIAVYLLLVVAYSSPDPLFIMALFVIAICAFRVLFSVLIAWSAFAGLRFAGIVTMADPAMGIALIGASLVLLVYAVLVIRGPHPIAGVEPNVH